MELTGKRGAEAMDTDEAVGEQSQLKVQSQAQCKRRKKVTRELWPQAWIEQHKEFTANPKDTNKRRALYLSWPRALRDQVWYWVSTGVREQMDMWDASQAAPEAS